MISLNDAQLKSVMAAAAQVPYEKRAQFLERIAPCWRFAAAVILPTTMSATW